MYHLAFRIRVSSGKVFLGKQVQTRHYYGWDRYAENPLLQRPVNLSRLLPAPPLTYKRKDWGATSFIAYAPQDKNNINTVGTIWGAPDAYNSGKMKVFLQFISTPTADTPGTTLYLHFDHKRYLIGQIAEGTQRVGIETKLPLTRVGDLLLTGRIGWDSVGGLLGMMLTLADSLVTTKKALAAENEGKAGLPKKKEKTAEGLKPFMNVHGGRNLTHFFATARRFIFRKGVPIHTQEFTPENTILSEDGAPTWKDDQINVWAMAVDPEGTVPARKLSDFSSVEEFKKAEKEAAAAEDISNQQRKGVLADMFDSEWKLDALVATRLSDVKLPAKIFVRREGKIVEYDGSATEDIEVLVRNPWPGATIAKLPSTTPSKSSVSYIIKGYPQRGKFNAQAALDLGVAKKQNAELANGKTITTAAGKIVRPDQVVGQGTPGAGFVVLEIPDASYIAPTLERKEWSMENVMQGIGVVIWILGPGVVADVRIQDFMKTTKQKFEHIVSSVDVCPNNLAMQSVAAAAIKLHLVDSKRFPIPKHSNVFPNAVGEDVPYQVARIGKTVQITPKVEIQDGNIVPFLDTASTVRGFESDTKKLAADANRRVSDPRYLAALGHRQRDIPSPDAEVFTLGTGSSLPSKYRNVSATLIRVPGYGSYLLDCGENTLGQLKRVFGSELPEVLRDLKAIWISHLHADHHLGTAAVVKAFHEATKNDAATKNKKLIIASDLDMLLWLREYAEVEDFGYSRVKEMQFGGGGDFHIRFRPLDTASYGLSAILTCKVRHCRNALAVVLHFPNGFKVAYSGDCRPSEEFARIGRDATLLIHEATFDDALQGDAIAKAHSTTSEALKVGQRMNARRIVLTHFSQRYQKIPVMQQGSETAAVVAFDYMRVKVGDIAVVEEYMDALSELYKDEAEEMQKTQLRRAGGGLGRQAGLKDGVESEAGVA